MIGEISPPADLIAQRPAVVPLRFSFDFLDFLPSKSLKKQKDRIISFLQDLGNNYDLKELILILSKLNKNFDSKISSKVEIPALKNFDFGDQFSTLKKGDLLVFEAFYDDYLENYLGPIFLVLGGKNKKCVRLNFIDDFYILPPEAVTIITENEGASLDGVSILYPSVNILAIEIPRNLNLKDITGRKIFGSYFLGDSSSKTLTNVGNNLLYLGDKI